MAVGQPWEVTRQHCWSARCGGGRGAWGGGRDSAASGTMWGNRIALLGGHAGDRTVLLVWARGGGIGHTIRGNLGGKMPCATGATMGRHSTKGGLHQRVKPTSELMPRLAREVKRLFSVLP